MSYIQDFLNFIKRKKVKPPLRDKHGRPYYLTNQRLWHRYPRVFIIGGGLTSFLVLYSAPIYHAFFSDPSTVNELDTWWPHELQRGKRDIDILRERIAAAGPDSKFSDLFDRYSPMQHQEMLDKKMKKIVLEKIDLTSDKTD